MSAPPLRQAETRRDHTGSTKANRYGSEQFRREAARRVGVYRPRYRRRFRERGTFARKRLQGGSAGRAETRYRSSPVAKSRLGRRIPRNGPYQVGIELPTLRCERSGPGASACDLQLFLPKDRQLGEARSGEPVGQAAVDGCPDDGGREEGEAEGDAHRAFAAALVPGDLGRAREPSDDQPVKPEAGFGERLEQPGPGLGAQGPALRSGMEKRGLGPV